MKKSFFIFSLLLVHSFALYSFPNYNNGNGTILFEEVEGNKKTEIRKCEMKIVIGDELSNDSKIIYDDYKTCNEIGRLKSGDNVQIFEICTIKFSEKLSDWWGNPYGERWYRIQSEQLSGWVHRSISSGDSRSDPYYDNRFEIIETIKINGRKTNVRRLNQFVTIWENLNIRNLPDVSNTSVLYTIRPGKTDPFQTNVDVIAISNEKITIDGRSDYWFKINYKDYEGWIFGGYASVERGGPKYYLPEIYVYEDF